LYFGIHQKGLKSRFVYLSFVPKIKFILGKPGYIVSINAIKNS